MNLSSMKQRLRSNPSVQKFSYFFFLVSIFLLFFLFLFVQFQNATLQTLTHVNRDFLIQIDTANNAIMDNIRTSAMQMFYTSSIKNLQTKTEFSNSDVIIGTRDLGNFVSSSDFLESVMVYNGKQDMIFTSEEQYSGVKSLLFHDQEAASLLANAEEHPYFSPMKRSIKGKELYSFLFYDKTSVYTNALLVNVSGQWFDSHLLGVSSLGSNIVVNKEGALVIHSDAQLSEQVIKAWPKINQEIERHPDGGFVRSGKFFNDDAWLYQYWEETGWYYIKQLNLGEAAPGIVYIRKFLFISFAVLVSLLIGLLIYIFIKVYLPLSQVRGALSDSGLDSNNITDQMKELLTHQKKSHSADKLKLLKKGIRPESFEFPLLLIKAVGKDLGDCIQIIREASDQALVVSEGDSIIAIIPASTPVIYRELISLVQEKVDTPLYFSRPSRTSQELKESFEAIEELEKIRFLYPDDTIMHQDLLEQCNKVSGLQTKDVVTLINLLKAGELEPAVTQWQLIFSAIRGDRYADFSFAIKYIIKQLGALYKEYGLDRPLLPYGDLDQLDSIDQLHHFMDTQFKGLAEASVKRKFNQLTSLAQEINDYIKADYANTELSAQLVAEHFQVSPAYLNRQYRQVAGMSISNAIHQTRVEKAGNLLRESSEAVEHIAQQVGYLNTKYFFVVFKKIKKQTPKQYRESE